MIRRDPRNDERIAAYHQRVAMDETFDPCELKRRYMRGLAIQRDLNRSMRPKPSAAVIPIRRAQRK